MSLISLTVASQSRKTRMVTDSLNLLLLLLLFSPRSKISNITEPSFIFKKCGKSCKSEKACVSYSEEWKTGFTYHDKP